MKILFVHQNFPAQYQNVAPALLARGHELRAIADGANRKPNILPTERYSISLKQPPGINTFAEQFNEHVTRGQIVAQIAAKMKSGGYAPDVICGHLGWGETLFLKDVWPDARLLIHAEFYYQSEGADVGFDSEVYPMTLNARVRVRARQASLQLAMSTADRAQTATNWQAQVFPEDMRKKITVVHEGINTRLCSPNSETFIQLKNGTVTLRPGDEVITFVNRNLEPYRGYHIFMRALPAILKARPNARVVIVGGDEISYGGAPNPKQGKTWREIYFREVRDQLDLSRVHFVGKIPYTTFVQLMQVSAVHPYLTYPFVLSWSMLEAMSCGALIIGSRTKPVEEVITDGNNGKLVDFFDVEGWSEAIIDALARPKVYRAMRARARTTVVERYDLASICLPQQVALVESMRD
jgi:glycosyltransferase involved in cell wall biosynthesis